MTLYAFIFLVGSLLSLWIHCNPWIWGTLFGISILFGVAAGMINWIGCIFILALISLWVFYSRKPNALLFVLLVILNILLKMRFLPGFVPFSFTPKFAVGLEGSLIGLLPLALLVPLARGIKDWVSVLKGLIVGCAGIAILALLATFTRATHWNFKLPSFLAARTLSNFFLTSIPEEGFYRGFIQNTFCKTFENMRLGKIFALHLHIHHLHSGALLLESRSADFSLRFPLESSLRRCLFDLRQNRERYPLPLSPKLHPHDVFLLPCDVIYTDWPSSVSRFYTEMNSKVGL
jgi:uncharacterized protein